MKEKQSGKIQTVEELDALVNAKYMEYHKKIDLKSFRWVRGEKKKNYLNFSPSSSFSSRTLADWYTIFRQINTFLIDNGAERLWKCEKNIMYAQFDFELCGDQKCRDCTFNRQTKQNRKRKK